MYYCIKSLMYIFNQALLICTYPKGVETTYFTKMEKYIRVYPSYTDICSCSPLVSKEYRHKVALRGSGIFREQM